MLCDVERRLERARRALPDERPHVAERDEVLGPRRPELPQQRHGRRLPAGSLRYM